MPAPRQPARRATSSKATSAATGSGTPAPAERGVPALAGPRSIVIWPDPVLLVKAAPVARIDAAIRDLVADMVRVMRLEEGAGLAGPQVGESLRIFVVEKRDAEDGRPPEPLGVYINPSIVSMEGPVEPYEEGCLSLPNIRADIRRPPIVTIRATDLDGREFTRTDDAMLARIWQHEYDHLDGLLILDRMTQMDRLATRRKVKELRDAYEG